MKQFYVTLLGIRAVVTSIDGNIQSVVVTRANGRVSCLPRECDAWKHIVKAMDYPDRCKELKEGTIIPACAFHDDTMLFTEAQNRG